MEKLRIGAVSYLNTKPLIFGFENGMMIGKADLIVDYPSNIASKLINDQLDIGLVPVAALSSLKEYYIVSDYCIGSDGEVASVCLFSEVPVDEIKTVLLDYQSRTSVELLKILLNERWKVFPQLVNAEEGFEEKIKGTTAGLVIGDRALKLRKSSKYIYDLGLGWKKLTGLPFVFAVWAANKKIDPEILKQFNEANRYGLEHIDEVVKTISFEHFDVKKYFTEYISFDLTNEKKKAMDLFLSKLH